MGYQIEYRETIVRRNTMPTIRKKGMLHLVWLLGGVALAVMIYTGFGDRIKTMLIPGDPEITIPAFSELVESVQEGIPFSDALTEFCLEIVNGAEVS
jgi:hypothetical protein